MTINYIYLDPVTLEPTDQETGVLYRITDSGVIQIREAVNGTIDPFTGDFIPDPPPPLSPPGPDRIAALEAELADTKTQLAIARDVAAETSIALQELLEYLIDMEVIS